MWHQIKYKEQIGTWRINNDTLTLFAEFNNFDKIEPNKIKSDFIYIYSIKKNKIKLLDYKSELNEFDMYSDYFILNAKLKRRKTLGNNVYKTQLLQAFQKVFVYLRRPPNL